MKYKYAVSAFALALSACGSQTSTNSIELNKEDGTDVSVSVSNSSSSNKIAWASSEPDLRYGIQIAETHYKPEGQISFEREGFSTFYQVPESNTYLGISGETAYNEDFDILEVCASFGIKDEEIQILPSDTSSVSKSSIKEAIEALDYSNFLDTFGFEPEEFPKEQSRELTKQETIAIFQKLPLATKIETSEIDSGSFEIYEAGLDNFVEIRDYLSEEQSTESADTSLATVEIDLEISIKGGEEFLYVNIGLDPEPEISVYEIDDPCGEASDLFKVENPKSIFHEYEPINGIVNRKAKYRTVSGNFEQVAEQIQTTVGKE